MSIMEPDLHKLKISDPFLGQYQQLVRDVVIPYQWDALNDRITEAEPSHAIANFRIAAGQQSGEFYGMVFQDSDVDKWLEAVAWSLCQKPDAELEKTADEVIELIAAAQCEDGYLNTRRWMPGVSAWKGSRWAAITARGRWRLSRASPAAWYGAPITTGERCSSAAANAKGIFRYRTTGSTCAGCGAARC